MAVSESHPRRPPFRIGPSVYVKLIAYLAACWTMVAVVALLALYTALPLFVFLRFGGWPFYPRKIFRLFVLRVFWYAQLALPLVGGAALLGLIVGAPFAHPLAGARIGATITAITLGTFIAIGYFGANALVVRDVVAELPGLPPEFDGFRIAQLTDLHVGPHLPRRRLEGIAREVRKLTPDMIAVTGDMIDDRSEDLDVYAAVFGSMTAPHGVYLIPGNHDIYAGWPAVERRLRRGDLGTLLVNESREVRRGSAVISLAGTGDPAGRGFADANVAPDVERTLAGIPPGRTTIVLAHNPALFEALAEGGVALTLSGHTHWGQLALPAASWSLAGMFLEDAMGINTRGNSLLYISPGTGYWGIPFRIGATGEITVVTLRRSADGHPRAHVTSRRRVPWLVG
jgi:hypothetical protein